MVPFFGINCCVCSNSSHTTGFSIWWSVESIGSLKKSKNYLSKFLTFISLKHTELTMKLCIILATISFCSCSFFDLAQNQPENDEKVILGEILNNYIRKYFIDGHFVSLIILPSEREQNRDIFNSFSNRESTGFIYNILDKLDNTTRDSRSSLNLIVVDESKQLQWV